MLLLALSGFPNADDGEGLKEKEAKPTLPKLPRDIRGLYVRHYRKHELTPICCQLFGDLLFW